MSEENKTERIDITILTVNWNSCEKLQKCIASVIATCSGLKYKMIVIDNDSKDCEFNDVVRKFSSHKQIVFIKNSKNEGGLVLNRVQDQIAGRYLLFLGPDVIVKEQAIKNLVKFMDLHPQAGGVSAKLLYPDGSPQFYYYKFWDLKMYFYLSTVIGREIDYKFFKGKKHEYYLGRNVPLNKVQEIEQPSGACLMVRPDLLLEDGFIIDPRFPFYFNDADICKRIWDKGYKIYLVPSAEAIHDQSYSFRKTEGNWRNIEFTKSFIEYMKKYYPRKMVVILKIVIVMNSLLDFLLQIKTILKSISHFEDRSTIKMLIKNKKQMIWETLKT